jgi:CRP-like cAMP-binding protein
VNPVPRFDAKVFLESAGGPKAVVKFESGETVFRQGDAGKDVFYIQSGGVKLSVLSRTGKEAVVAMIGPG